MILFIKDKDRQERERRERQERKERQDRKDRERREREKERERRKREKVSFSYHHIKPVLHTYILFIYLIKQLE